MPGISTFPAYSASVPDYQAAVRTFAARAERTLYFRGVLTNRTIDYTRPAGQYVPYSVQDVYGSKVLPDTLAASIRPCTTTFRRACRRILSPMRSARS